MVGTSQTTFLNAFSWIKIVAFSLKMSLQFVQYPSVSIDVGNGLEPHKWQAIIWIDYDLVYSCLDGMLGFDVQ